jgi:hypothetical protein
MTEIWVYFNETTRRCEISSLMMEAVRTSETSVDNHFIRQYIPEDNSEHPTRRSFPEGCFCQTSFSSSDVVS